MTKNLICQLGCHKPAIAERPLKKGERGQGRQLTCLLLYRQTQKRPRAQHTFLSLPPCSQMSVHIIQTYIYIILVDKCWYTSHKHIYVIYHPRSQTSVHIIQTHTYHLVAKGQNTSYKHTSIILVAKRQYTSYKHISIILVAKR